MTMLIEMAGAAALAGILAAPAAAQVTVQPIYPPNSYPQSYPQPYPQPGYPGYQPGYQDYNYGYPNSGGGVIGQVMDNLLGSRYNVTDRRAVSQCAGAAVAQAQNQYRNWGYGMPGYNQWGNNWRQNYNRMRVTAVTNVDRRRDGLRVSGLIDSGRRMYAQGYGGYGQGYNQGYYQGYNQAYASGDLSFRCNVDWRGAVTNIRVREANNNGYRRY